jgi:3'-phosphoadenosine 5'-phosphosulfate sulfotransferase (PAPS reductase)/FAD synthetase
MSDPFKIDGPALISFSGGRTSAYMLWRIIQAHGGKLPGDVHVAFANTGKEREETLRFVHECGTRWGVKVRWLEWRDKRREYERFQIAVEETFEEVGLNSASRNGEPFEALIRKKQRLPNWQERWCTGILKLATLFDFAEAVGLVAGKYAEVIGLRFDEMDRVADNTERAKATGRLTVYPLAKAGVRKSDVMRFWLGENTDPRALTHPLPQGFDLGLRDHEGNCDLCFLKGRGLRKAVIRDDPSAAIWWDQQERWAEGFFDRRDRVADLVAEVRQQPDFFVDYSVEHTGECSTQCAAEAA